MRVFLATLLFASSVQASDLVHQFSSPAFSGNGWSTHVLTIDQLERQRKQQIEDDKQAAIDKAEREYKSTNAYKFRNNLESRIYAQLSKQIADNLFSDTCPEGQECYTDGEWVTSSTPFGDIIRWKKDSTSDEITVEIYTDGHDPANMDSPDVSFSTLLSDFTP